MSDWETQHKIRREEILNCWRLQKLAKDMREQSVLACNPKNEPYTGSRLDDSGSCLDLIDTYANLVSVIFSTCKGVAPE